MNPGVNDAGAVSGGNTAWQLGIEIASVTQSLRVAVEDPPDADP